MSENITNWLWPMNQRVARLAEEKGHEIVMG